ncbi:MAG: hypothetical protein IKV94_03145 [Clostridia bacterium]|nr:hypothetical protein [Clostridia bacterium]
MVFNNEDAWVYNINTREGIIAYGTGLGESKYKQYISEYYNRWGTYDYTMEFVDKLGWIKVTFKHKKYNTVSVLYFNPKTKLMEATEDRETGEIFITNMQINCVTDEDMEIPSDIKFTEYRK